MESPPYISVIGPAEATAAQVAAAEEVGRLAAGAGAVVVTGGHGGVMAAASRGAHEAGGVTIGLLPGPDRSGANQWLTVSVPTGIGELRNGLVIRTGDAVIACGGSWGTLSEVALAIRIGRPVIALGEWEFGELPEAETEGLLQTAASPDEAVDMALEAARRPG